MAAAFSLRLHQVFKAHGLTAQLETALMEKMTCEFLRGASVVMDMRTDTPHIAIVPPTPKL